MDEALPTQEVENQASPFPYPRHIFQDLKRGLYSAFYAKIYHALTFQVNQYNAPGNPAFRRPNYLSREWVVHHLEVAGKFPCSSPTRWQKATVSRLTEKRSRPCQMCKVHLTSRPTTKAGATLFWSAEGARRLQWVLCGPLHQLHYAFSATRMGSPRALPGRGAPGGLRRP